MRKVFLATLGFDATVVISSIVQKGLSPRDEIYLITASAQHPRAESAAKSVQDFVEKINPKVKVRVLHLDERNPEESISELVKLILEASRSAEVVVDVSGGPKSLSLALFAAASLAGVQEVGLTVETTGEKIRFPALPTPLPRLTEKQLQALKLLPLPVKELASRMGVTTAAASRLLRRMSERGVVAASQEGYAATLLGRLLLKLRSGGR
ncbi:MAG: CRISPR-associated CARF protein Csa3 [Thermofilaceae archaeon]